MKIELQVERLYLSLDRNPVLCVGIPPTLIGITGYQLRDPFRTPRYQTAVMFEGGFSLRMRLIGPLRDASLSDGCTPDFCNNCMTNIIVKRVVSNSW